MGGSDRAGPPRSPAETASPIAGRRPRCRVGPARSGGAGPAGHRLCRSRPRRGLPGARRVGAHRLSRRGRHRLAAGGRRHRGSCLRRSGRTRRRAPPPVGRNPRRPGAAHGEGQLCRDSETDPRTRADRSAHPRTRSSVIVPLVHEGRSVALISAVSSRPDTFDEADLADLRMLADVATSRLVAALAERERSDGLARLRAAQAADRPGVVGAQPRHRRAPVVAGDVPAGRPRARARGAVVGRLPRADPPRRPPLGCRPAAQGLRHRPPRRLPHRAPGRRRPARPGLDPRRPRRGRRDGAGDRRRDRRHRPRGAAGLRRGEPGQPDRRARAHPDRHLELGRRRRPRRLVTADARADGSPSRDAPPATAAEVLGHVHPEDRAGVRAVAERILATGQGEEALFRAQHADGSVRHVRAWTDVRRGAAGSLVELWGTAMDVTEQAESAARIRASEEHFRIAFDNAPIGMSMISLADQDRGCYLRANAAFEAMLGWIERRARRPAAQRPDPCPTTGSGTPRCSPRLARGETETVAFEKRYRHRNGDSRARLADQHASSHGARRASRSTWSPTPWTSATGCASRPSSSGWRSPTPSPGWPTARLLNDRLDQALARLHRTGGVAGDAAARRRPVQDRQRLARAPGRATPCWSRSPAGSRPSSGPTRRSPGWAATSSSCWSRSCRAPTPCTPSPSGCSRCCGAPTTSGRWRTRWSPPSASASRSPPTPPARPATCTARPTWRSTGRRTPAATSTRCSTTRSGPVRDQRLAAETPAAQGARARTCWSRCSSRSSTSPTAGCTPPRPWSASGTANASCCPAEFIDVAEETGLIVEVDARMFERVAAECARLLRPRRRLAAASVQRQRVGTVAGGPAVRRPDAQGPDVVRRAGLDDPGRAHRAQPAHDEPGRARVAGPDPGARHGGRPRRLRHRLLGAGLPAAVRPALPQDRPVLRRPARDQRAATTPSSVP